MQKNITLAPWLLFYHMGYGFKLQCIATKVWLKVIFKPVGWGSVVVVVVFSVVVFSVVVVVLLVGMHLLSPVVQTLHDSSIEAQVLYKRHSIS